MRTAASQGQRVRISTFEHLLDFNLFVHTSNVKIYFSADQVVLTWHLLGKRSWYRGKLFV